MGLRYYHCHIQIRSIEESLEFFCGQLGLIELAFYHDQRPISDGSRFAHIAFSVENLVYYCRQLEEQGVTILQTPVDDSYAYIQAPDGLVLELLQS